MAIDVSLKELIESGAHFGHQSRRWNPKMEEYIYSEKEGVHVFDLTITKQMLEEALEFLQQSAKEGKNIVLLGTKKQVKDKVAEVAKESGVFYVNERWLGGTITNFDQMKRSTSKLHDMKKKREQGEYKNRTNKERVLINREIERLERFFGGIADMDQSPEVLVVVDTKRESIAIKEANMNEIPVVGIVDSNADPTLIDYPIPMNDDASKGLEYVLDLVKDAILAGKAKQPVSDTQKNSVKTSSASTDKSDDKKKISSSSKGSKAQQNTESKSKVKAKTNKEDAKNQMNAKSKKNANH